MSLQQKQKIINLLTVCIKAGKTVRGYDSVCGAMKEGSAYCVLTASDISDKTLKETAFMCGKYNVPLVRTSLTKEDYGRFAGRPTAVTAVCDKGFAEKLAELAQSGGGEEVSGK